MQTMVTMKVGLEENVINDGEIYLGPKLDEAIPSLKCCPLGLVSGGHLSSVQSLSRVQLFATP